MKIGDDIEFKEELIERETSDHPSFILAKKGEKGKIVNNSSFEEKEWLVQPNGRNPFYAKEHEFKVLTL